MSWEEEGLTVEVGTGDVGWRRTVTYMVWVLVMAFFFANAEIQIEGGAGWATSLPTWRIEHHWLLDIFWGGRAMTGYHAWVFTFMALVFYSPLAFNGRGRWRDAGLALCGLMRVSTRYRRPAAPCSARPAHRSRRC